MTTLAQRSELASIVQKTIRSRPLGDVAELAHAIVDDIEDAGWTIAKADAIPYRLNFSVTAMRQRLDGHTDVEEEFIRISIRLPFLLRMLADPLASRVESDTELLLNKPAILSRD